MRLTFNRFKRVVLPAPMLPSTEIIDIQNDDNRLNIIKIKLIYFYYNPTYVCQISIPCFKIFIVTMPKLKKLSQLEAQKLQSSPPSQSNRRFQEQTHSQSKESKASDRDDGKLSDKKSLKVKPKREKNNKSKKTLKEENIKKANQALKTMIQQYADNQDSNPHQFIADGEFNQPKKRKSKKNPEKEIRVRNKYFKDIVVDDRPNYQTDLPEPELELQVEKKPENRQNEIGKIKSRFENKVKNIKNKLENKKYSEDPRFKEELKKAITNVENVKDENLNIVVDMPKVFSGPNMTEANALLLIKATKQKTSQPTQQVESKNQTFSHTEEKKKTKQHRRSFFNDLNKEIKMKKAISIENKEYFKKSSLDDFDRELDKNQHLLRDQSQTYPERHTNSNEESNSLSKESNLNHPKISTKKSQLPSPVIEEISHSIRVKKKKNKPKREIEENFLIKLTKQYKEEEAEDSDISGYHVEGEQSDENDDGDIESLIDYDSVQYQEKDQLNVRRLINQREKEQHERIMKAVREKYSKIAKIKMDDNSSSRKRIQRIKQAKKRYEQEDSHGADLELINFMSAKKENLPIESQEHLKQDFMNKLKDLERETGADKKKYTENQEKKVKNKKSIWEYIKVKERTVGEKKRGGFEKGKMVAGSKINTPKRRSKESKGISFDKNN